MRYITQQEITAALRHRELIGALEDTFRGYYEMPDRHHHFYKLTDGEENTLLLMPAWTREYLGLKQVIAAPGNRVSGAPSINGMYLLSETVTGFPLAMMDASALTAVRTACASALAAKYLVPENAATLLVMGNGKVAEQLIPAHLCVRNYQRILVWTRRPEAFPDFLRSLGTFPGVAIEPAPDLRAAVEQADVVSCATSSRLPLIEGAWLKEGQHLDLVGSFKMNMREADDEAILKCTLFADSKHGALHESGELGIPLEKGLITEESVAADLAGLCRGLHPGRTSPQEITLFKSVGLAIEDLAAAILVYKHLCS